MLTTLPYGPADRADLHVHSHWSDGALSPVELVDLAVAHGLRTLAVTDHAEVRAFPELAFAALERGLLPLPGVELNSADGDFLGYCFDPLDPDLLAFLELVREQRAERIGLLLRRLGTLVDPGALAAEAAPGPISRTAIARHLVARGSFPSTDAVFRELLGRCGSHYEPGTAPSADACIAAIRAAGGIAVEAHPQFTPRPQGLDAHFRDLAERGVAGIEAADESTASAARAAGLLAVGGSNFHGVGVTAARFAERVVDGPTLRTLVGASSWPKRSLWRAANLSRAELRASFAPERVELRSARLSHLLDRPPARPAAAAPRPFVLVGPSAVGRESIVERELVRAGARPTQRSAVASYPELAWDLYGMRSPTDLLRFELDRHLFGPAARRGTVIHFAEPRPLDLRALKIAIRRALGPLRFHHVRRGDHADTCITTHVHLPDRERLAHECGILAAAR
ncbi:MAG: PHP domain-containing protein [Planctomycetes bacterium]|nr:PHP domain-containing protein [Planctomycetota bacterium]